MQKYYYSFSVFFVFLTSNEELLIKPREENKRPDYKLKVAVDGETLKERREQ